MKNSLFSTTPFNADLGILFLRLIFGGMFAYTGYQKVEAYDQYASVFPDYLGIGPAGNYILVIFAELVCGFFIAIGFLTRLSVIPILITMCFVLFKAHINDPFDQKQLPFVYLLLCLPIFVFGSGKYSLDSALFKK